MFKLYYTQLCYFAHAMVHNHAEAEDLVAESMIKLWRLHTNFETQEKIKAFLYITLRHACLDYLKHNNRKLPHREEYAYYENTVKLLEENSNFVTANITRAEVMQEIHQEINTLPKKCRAIFNMSFIEGMKNEDIARSLNLSYHTVKAQKVRALKMLRLALLKKEFFLSLKIFLLFF